MKKGAVSHYPLRFFREGWPTPLADQILEIQYTDAPSPPLMVLQERSINDTTESGIDT